MTPYNYGHKEWRSAYSGVVLGETNTRFGVVAVHMSALQKILTVI